MTNDIEILSPEIRNFISRYFDSVALLEILLFFQQGRAREWTTVELNAKLKSNPVALERRTNDLVSKGFLKRGSSVCSYQYNPTTEEMNRLVETLAELYKQYQVRIVDQIYNPNKRAIQEFADAFKITKGDDNG